MSLEELIEQSLDLIGLYSISIQRSQGCYYVWIGHLVSIKGTIDDTLEDVFIKALDKITAV